VSARVPAVKMSGAGNDFVVVAAGDLGRISEPVEVWVRAVCRRGISIGADGVLVVGPAGHEGRVRVRFYNPDATAAFCGNGSRCAARFAWLRGLVGAPSMILETAAGDVPADVRGESVSIVLPLPRDDGAFRLEIGGEIVAGRLVTAGVPHAIVRVPAASSAPLERWGPLLRSHSRFGAAGANVDVVERVAPDRLVLRTWERGVEGETLACGSGAVAVAFAEFRDGGPSRCTVVPASRIALEIELEAGAPGRATLTGDARIVFEGEIGPEAWA